MIQDNNDTSSETITVSTKLSRDEFSRLNYYCKKIGETKNPIIRRLILSEIDNPKPALIARKSTFEYQKDKDNFAWRIVLDDGTIFDLSNNLTASTVEQLFGSLEKAMDVRNSFIKKHKHGSVSIPTKLMRKNK